MRAGGRGAGRRAWCGRGAGVVGRRAWCGRGAGRDLVHEIPPALISPFPLHQVPRVFSTLAGADLVHEIPPALISQFPLHQVPRVSSSVAGADLVHETPPVLVLPFPLHQVPRVFSPVAGGRGASPPANPPFVVNSNHLPVPLAPTCIRHHKKLTTDSRIRKVCRQSNFFFMFLL